MNNTPARILLVDDDEDDYVVTRDTLAEIEDWSFRLEWVTTYEAALEAIEARSPDVCLVDYRLGSRTGLELIQEVAGNGSTTPLILLTGQGDRQVDIDAMRAGAADYLVKGHIDPLLLERSIRYSVQRRRAEETRRDLEARLLQSQKMDSVGRLAGGLAHELNNLLTPILGYANHLMDQIPSAESALHSNLAEIEKAATRASSLVHQLLAFSHRQVFQPQVVSLQELVLDVSGMLRRLIGEEIELVVLPDSNAKPVKAVPSLIQQVLVNLTVNARDALPGGGKIVVQVANSGSPGSGEQESGGGPADPADYVVLSVADNGTGMSDEVKAHLFEPFYTTKEVGKGTGLGLATSYGIVTQLRGLIRIESELGQGTCVKIYLPAVDEPVGEQVSPPAREPLPRGTETVLLVEDEPSVRLMAIRVLKDLGYRVLQAADGEHALRVVQECPKDDIHLVVADAVMPRMGGLELVHALKKIRPGTRVLLISGYSEGIATSGNGMPQSDKFLAKPFTPESLARSVREALAAPGPGQ